MSHLALSMEGKAASRNVQEIIRGAAHSAARSGSTRPEEALRECGYSEEEIRRLLAAGAV
jgi:Holliday junction resolvasome RuvABC DNA-binding subunit